MRDRDESKVIFFSKKYLGMKNDLLKKKTFATQHNKQYPLFLYLIISWT